MGHVASKFETELGERAAELAAAITTYKNELDGKVQVPGTLRCSTARLPPPLLRVQRCVCGCYEVIGRCWRWTFEIRWRCILKIALVQGWETVR